VGYALRQIDPHPGALRIGDLIALRVEGRTGPQIAVIRWFRNQLTATGLEFGCEILSDAPEAAAASVEAAPESRRSAAIVLPAESAAAGGEDALPQVIVEAGIFGVDQGLTLTRGGHTGVAVLTKLIEQGPEFEIYDFASVG
jgi:hypothetical protein